MEHEYGVDHPHGGCGAIMGALARVARDLGVKIKRAEPVEEILFEGRRAVGVHSNGVEQRFDALVVNADLVQTMTNLVPDAIRRRWTDRRIATKKFSCSTFMMYLGLEGAFPDLAHHTIYLAKNYRRNLAEIEAAPAPGEPSFYVQNAYATDPALAPPGHSTLYVLVPVEHRVGAGIDWSAEQARYRALVLKRLERIGITDIERRIRFEKVLTPQGWEDDLQVSAAPRSTSPTTCARCCTSGRATASRTSTGLSRRRRHPPRPRPAAHLRERPHHRAADGRGPRPATGLGRAQHHGAPRLRPCPSRRRYDPLACFVRACPARARPARPVRRPVNAISRPQHVLPVGVVGAGLGGLAAACLANTCASCHSPAHLHDDVCHEPGANAVIRLETGLDISDHMVNIFTICHHPDR